MHVDRLKFYSQRQFALKMTTQYCLQKSQATKKKAMHLLRGNTQDNGTLLKLSYLCLPFCQYVLFLRFLFIQLLSYFINCPVFLFAILIVFLVVVNLSLIILYTAKYI